MANVSMRTAPLFDPSVRLEIDRARDFTLLANADHESDLTTHHAMNHVLHDGLRQTTSRAEGACKCARHQDLGGLDVDASRVANRATQGHVPERLLNAPKPKELQRQADRRGERPRDRGERSRRWLELDKRPERTQRGHRRTLPRVVPQSNALPFVHELSQRAPVRSLTILAIALEALAKVTLLGTLFLLFVAPSDPLQVAMIAACVSATLTAARTLLRGELLRRRLIDVFGAVESELRRKSLPELLTSRDRMSSGALFEAAFDVSSTQSTAFPDALAACVVISVILGTVSIRLGPQFLLLGAVGAGLMLLLLAPLRRRARNARDEAWKGHARSMRMLDALVFGSFEVRGAGAEARLGARVREMVARVARFERQAHWLSITSALIPAALAIALLVVPRAWMETLLRDRLGEASVLAVAGVSATVSLVTALEALARGAPCRVTLSNFLKRHVGFFAPLGASLPASLDTVAPPKKLTVERFHHRYTDAVMDTPHAISFELSERGGIAIVGPNGSGKTTTLMALLGLVESAAVRIDDEVPSGVKWPALRAHTCVLPQRAHVVPDESIGWHLSLFGTSVIKEAKICAALDTFGLLALLEDRARRKGCAISDLTMGELSGGEQRRVLLSRVVLSDARIVLLDEPEVGLDETSRGRLRAFLEECAATRMVILVCHHASVIPDGWPSVEAGTNAVRSAADPAIDH